MWQNCKSDKARAEKLLELLHERGLRGKPSISECRKLKKRYETEKEIAELNRANIITSTGMYFVLFNVGNFFGLYEFASIFHLSFEGRSRRGAAQSRESPKDCVKEESAVENSSEFKKVFSRLKSIVDSEGSD